MTSRPRIAFLIPGPGLSGGIAVVFRQAMELTRLGMTVAFVCKLAIGRKDLDWHPIAAMFGDPHLLWLNYDEVLEHHFDLVIATWWETFFDLWKIDADRYAYFVQSIESRFYPRSDRVSRTAVDATYEGPIGFVTEANWIRRYLRQIHGQEAELALNGVDKSVYRPEGPEAKPHDPGRLRVLVEGPLSADFKNVPLSVRLAREAGADEVWLLTSSAVTQMAGVDRVFSRIPQVETASVYRACDVLLKLSTVEGMFGPPLEMFHCGGTAIVYDVTGHDEYIVHGRNALVARMHDEAAVRTCIARLRDTPELLAGLKSGALETADAWPDWRESGRQFAAAVNALMQRAAPPRTALGTYSRRIWQIIEDSRIEKAEHEHCWAERLVAVEQEKALSEAECERRRGLEEARIRALEARVDDVQAQLATVYSSSSWRATRPLRVAKRALTEKEFIRRAIGMLFRPAGK